MKLALPRRRPIREVSFVTMGDIAFQLIIFFMVTTTFMRDGTRVETPLLAITDKTESSISVALNADGLFLDGEPVDTPSGLSARLSGLLAGRTTPEERQVRLRCDRTLTQAAYKPVIEAIANAGGVLAIMHDPDLESER